MNLLDRAPFGPRDDAELLHELAALTEFHREACAPYANLIGAAPPARALTDIPFVHVGLFKEMDLRSHHASVRHQRVLKSSATTSGISSRIALDDESSRRQSRSVVAILTDFIGAGHRPLIVLDDPKELRRPHELSARMAAGLSMRAIASDLRFVLRRDASGSVTDWSVVRDTLEKSDAAIVYGFTSMLWTAWAAAEIPDDVRALMRGRRIAFVHSGGWKKLEALRVSRAEFESTLLSDAGPGSTVLDYYGLVEQVGIVFPMCPADARHVPLWAEVIIRDPYTLEPIADGPGQLQLMNSLPLGAPYHSVLTEDLGRLMPGVCACGREGRRFELLGRIPQAELRGCANV